MKVTEIRYRRVANLGNYESEALEVEAALEDGEHPEEVYLELKQWVADRLPVRPATGRR